MRKGICSHMATSNSQLFLGIRTSPQQTRFAIVEREDSTCTLLNASSESLIQRPAGFEEHDPEYANWLFDEITRLLRQHPVEHVALKLPEFTRAAPTKSTRLRNYLDAAVMIAATKSNIPISTKLYTQMATSSQKVKNDAQARVGQTAAHWDGEIADAIVAAWSLER